MTKIVVFFSVITVVVLSEQPVKLEFVKGVARLNTTGYIDYYFLCNAIGRFLQWKYNNEPLTAFQSADKVGDSNFLWLPHKIGNYTTTLLSSVPLGDNNAKMDSIIIVSLRGELVSVSFNITCNNGSISETRSVEPVSNVTNSSLWYDNDNFNSDIVLEYITSHEIVGSTNIHLFICGANSLSLQLQTNISSPLAFTSSDALGDHSNVSDSMHSVNAHGVFIARNPYNITSVFFIAHKSDVEVTCFAGNMVKTLHSNISYVNNITARPAADLDTSTEFSPAPTKDHTESIYDTTTTYSKERKGSSNMTSSMLYAVIGVPPVFIFAIVAALVVGILLYRKYTRLSVW